MEEIESIARVFAYEQRMRRYASPQKSPASTPVTQHTPTPVHRLAPEKPLRCFRVKGLC
ncbi:MAG TPA: hypothetical protein VMT57_04915 [Candidatus Thermoplasmatota archaeon]|nr:hypothetical protein [Candidatus Thermoplasmatota archaeon]